MYVQLSPFVQDPTTPILLTPQEVKEADTVAISRQVENILRKRRDAYGAVFSPEEGLTKHIEGARAERAFAKLIGLAWDGNLGNLDADDVGPYQVRSTAYARGRLFLHPRDKDEKVYVLLIGAEASFRAVGWIWGHEGKRVGQWGDPSGHNRPCYLVEHHQLHPMDTLPVLGALALHARW